MDTLPELRVVSIGAEPMFQRKLTFKPHAYTCDLTLLERKVDDESTPAEELDRLLDMHREKWGREGEPDVVRMQSFLSVVRVLIEEDDDGTQGKETPEGPAASTKSCTD